MEVEKTKKKLSPVATIPVDEYGKNFTVKDYISHLSDIWNHVFPKTLSTGWKYLQSTRLFIVTEADSDRFRILFQSCVFSPK